MSFPNELKYSKEHEWVLVEGNTAKIGITTFAVEQLGDVTQVELPEVGESISKDDVFGSVESVKAVSDLFAPISGKVTQSNMPLNDSPETVNDEPYEGGWMVEVEISDASELDELMDHTSYTSFVEEQ